MSFPAVSQIRQGGNCRVDERYKEDCFCLQVNIIYLLCVILFGYFYLVIVLMSLVE